MIERFDSSGRSIPGDDISNLRASRVEGAHTRALHIPPDEGHKGEDLVEQSCCEGPGGGMHCLHQLLGILVSLVRAVEEVIVHRLRNPVGKEDIVRQKIRSFLKIRY